MFKRIFALLLFSISFISPSQAQTITITEEQMLKKAGIDCSAKQTLCLDKFTIKDYIYNIGLLKCGKIEDTMCKDHVLDKSVYSKNRDALVQMRFQNYAEMNTSKYQKILGYENCVVKSNWTYCDIYGERRPYDGWCGKEGCIWSPYKLGTGFSVGLSKSPSNCSEGTYMPGIGCTTTTSQRVTSVLKNSCQTGDCPSLSLAQSNRNPVEGSIDLMSGSKVESKTDIKTPFEFSRTYVSKRVNSGQMGNNWKHNYEKSLRTYSVTNQLNESFIGTVIITQENDEEITFTRLSSTEPFISSYKDQKNYSLTIDNISPLHAFTLKAPNGNEEIYSLNGQLVEMKNRSGYKLNFSYSGTQLNQITDTYGKSISFEYSGQAIIKATSSTGNIVTYSYNGGMLASQTLNNGRNISYGYEGNNLISKTNAKGQLVSSYVYDSSNNAIQSTDYGVNGAVNVTSVVYPDPKTTSPIIVKQNGVTKNYHKTTTLYKNVPTTSNLRVGTQAITKEIAAYSGGNLSSIKDAEGNAYHYTYDTDGWLLTTNKDNTITSFTWDKINNLLLSTTVNNKTTNYTYNNDGLLIEKSIITNNSDTRTWSYTWASLGKLESQTEPNGAVTNYTYYSDYDSDNLKGKLYKMTNALGHEITINSYDDRGNPTSITLENGLIKNYTYNDLGQILTETINDSVTQYTYDEDGLLNQIQSPTGYTVKYGYDPLGRRVSLTDNMGGAISYTYGDGNTPINESVYANSTLQLTENRILDGLGRLVETWKSDPNEKYSYIYNSLTNFKPYSETDPLGSIITYTYNKSLLSDESGFGNTLKMSYDKDENINRINANTVIYTMTYNEFSEVLTSTNLNTGADSYTYDIINRINTKTDSSGIVHTTQYDLLNRPLSINSSNMEKIFVYDSIQLGKLTSAQNGNTLIEYTYDSLGNPLTKNQSVNGFNKTISYEYNHIGQITKMTYPSGLEINYTYSNGLINNITASGLGSIIENINYQPITFIPLSWTWGNNLNRLKTLDISGKITSLTDGVLNQTYTLNGVFNVKSLNDNGINKKYSSYIMKTNSLSQMSGDLGTMKYNIGSKLERTRLTDSNGKIINYYYTNLTNKLDYLSEGSKNYFSTYDSKGNTLSNTLGLFTYNNQNNMDTATANGEVTSYIYNAFDERVAKIGAEVNKIFMYNDNHQLIGEYEGNTGTEYIYLGSTPIATYKNGQIFFIHTDHLETPRAITNSSGSTVWKWDNIDPFGKNAATNLGIDFNLRFMGQYFDNETGLFYNYYRYYNPTIGRYMQADPIGIDGGLDTYGYAGQNPINAVDPLGLCPCGDPKKLIELARAEKTKRHWGKYADRSDIHRKFVSGENKCNLFVDFNYENAGYHLPNTGRNFLSKLLGMSPQWAVQLSRSDHSISGWPVVSGPMQPGDLVSGYGHTGIATSSKTTISASDKEGNINGTIENDWGTRYDQKKIVIRRCSCN